MVNVMAKIETYGRLFADIERTIRANLPNKGDVDALCKIVSHSKPAILGRYHELNRSVKAEYMAEGAEKLDRHKCGACFMVAFEKKLIVMPHEKQYEIYRERIAIHAGLSIVGSYAEDEARRDGNHAMVAHIDANDGFVVPESTQDQKPYEEIWAMGLRRIYTDEQEVKAALSVAKELFWIEIYNNELAKKLP